MRNRKQMETDEESKFRVISFSPEEPRAIFPVRKTPWSVPVAASASARGQEGHGEGCKHSTVPVFQLRYGEKDTGPEPGVLKEGSGGVLEAKPK